MREDKSSLLSRRDVLACAGVLLFGPETVLGQTREGETTLYVDESGNLGTNAPAVIGALVTTAADHHLKACSDMRRKVKYRLTLRYGSNDKHKLPYAEKLIEHFLAEKDLRFCAYALSSAKNAKWPTDPKIREIEYHNAYRKLLALCAPKNQAFSVNLKLRTTTGEDRFLHEFLKKEFKKLEEVKVLTTRENDLMQFADLLAGCVAAEKAKPRSTNKQMMVESLKVSLSVKELWRDLARHQKFRVVVA